MPAGQCRKCSYPLDDNEVVKRACPACGASLRDFVPFRPAGRPEGFAAPPPRRSFLWPLTGMTLLALASFGVGLYVMPPPESKPQPSSDRLLASAAEKVSPVPEPPKAPPKTTEPKKEPKPEAPKKEPPPAVKTPPPPRLPEVLDGNDRRLDRPDGEYHIGAILRGTTLKLSGKVKTLRIGIVDDQSTLDASALEAREVFFAGRIAGGSTVKVRAPGGRVEFKSKVDGESRLEVDAPGGFVSFTEATQLPREGSKIDGDSRVAVTAKVADFRGILNGERTRVVVTLTKGGLLFFRELDGSATLQYRKADPRDPNPRILGGEVHGAARLQRLD